MAFKLVRKSENGDYYIGHFKVIGGNNVRNNSDVYYNINDLMFDGKKVVCEVKHVNIDGVELVRIIKELDEIEVLSNLNTFKLTQYLLKYNVKVDASEYFKIDEHMLLINYECAKLSIKYPYLLDKLRNLVKYSLVNDKIEWVKNYPDDYDYLNGTVTDDYSLILWNNHFPNENRVLENLDTNYIHLIQSENLIDVILNGNFKISLNSFLRTISKYEDKLKYFPKLLSILSNGNFSNKLLSDDLINMFTWFSVYENDLNYTLHSVLCKEPEKCIVGMSKLVEDRLDLLKLYWRYCSDNIKLQYVIDNGISGYDYLINGMFVETKQKILYFEKFKLSVDTLKNFICDNDLEEWLEHFPEHEKCVLSALIENGNINYIHWLQCYPNYYSEFEKFLSAVDVIMYKDMSGLEINLDEVIESKSWAAMDSYLKNNVVEKINLDKILTFLSYYIEPYFLIDMLKKYLPEYANRFLYKYTEPFEIIEFAKNFNDLGKSLITYIEHPHDIKEWLKIYPTDYDYFKRMEMI